MIDLMDRPNGCFNSDSDDDRHSSSQSATSASEYTGETRLPSSLRKLLNPMLPSAQQPLPMVSLAAGGPVTSPRMCYKEEVLTSNDLTRLRPWKRLPPPRPLNAQPHVSLPPIYVCIPPPRTPNGTRESCSPGSPQFSPYYFPASHSSRNRNGRVNHLQLSSEGEEICKTHDARASPFITTPPSSSNSRPLSMDKINDFQTHTKKKLNTLYDPVYQETTIPRPEQHKLSKKLNKAHEKERNRCLTCGSAFSTFANLTRHEKKCPMSNSKTI